MLETFHRHILDQSAAPHAVKPRRPARSSGRSGSILSVFIGGVARCHQTVPKLQDLADPDASLIAILNDQDVHAGKHMIDGEAKGGRAVKTFGPIGPQSRLADEFSL